MINLKDVTFKYPSLEDGSYEGQACILKGINLKAEAGDFIVIAGEVGCGKSTLLRLLSDGLKPNGLAEGVIEVNGRTSLIMQNAEHQIVADKVWHEIVIGMENMAVSQEDMNLRLSEIASYLGIADILERDVTSLSGGQLRLVNLAAGLVTYPQILLLDEPLASLDPISADRFMNIIRKLNKETGITIIMTSHALDNLMDDVTKIVVLKKGESVFDGSVKDICECKDSYVEGLLPVSVLVYRALKEKGVKCDGFGMKEVASKYLELTGKSDGENKNDDKTPASTDAPVIKAENIYYRYDNTRDILKGISLSVNEGEIVAIAGGNGSGKSTLVRILAGIYKPKGGKIKKDKNLSIAYLPQNVESVLLYDSVEEYLDDVPRAIKDTFIYDFTEYEKSHPYDLSGGQKEMLALLFIMQTDAKLIILDEPAKGMDIGTRDRIIDYLKGLSQIGKTIIFVSHDTELIARLSDKVVTIVNGEASVTDTKKYLLNNMFYTTPSRLISKGSKKEGVIFEELQEAIRNA
ncbi:MAG: ATP-binding cassette domain-containing protein [Lachnospiraceae bacterium]|nr:ATP-binding cassette domain-containing protein [Lachnospiraceae bacterium]